MGQIVEEEIHRKSISFAKNLVPVRRAGSRLKRYEGRKLARSFLILEHEVFRKLYGRNDAYSLERDFKIESCSTIPVPF